MKHIIIPAAIFILLLSLNCNSNSSSTPKFFVGFAVPGDFRATGIAPEKKYTMFTGQAWQQQCGVPAPGRQCNAVYTYWFTPQTVITEGFAINDKVTNPTNPKFSMQVFHVAMFPAWAAYITLNGANYSGFIYDSDMTIIKTASTDDTVPQYTAPDSTILPASGVKIRLVTITFNNKVNLCNTGACISIEPNDNITAIDNSFF